MKTIILKESQLKGSKKYCLAPFVYNAIKGKKTPLGDCPIFPPTYNGVSYEYDIFKKRYKDVVDRLADFGLNDLGLDEIRNRYSKLSNKCYELEKPHKEKLEALAKNTVIDMFNIPIETVNLKCRIVGEVKPEHEPNIRPMVFDYKAIKHKDIESMDKVNEEVLKRRFLGTLIMGGSYHLSRMDDFYLREVYRMDRELPKVYDELDAMFNYIIFNSQMKFDEKSLDMDGYVETVLGEPGEKTDISAQGKTFPILLHETIKGLMELFISKGLPTDIGICRMVIGEADFLMAEPWDMMMGYGLWDDTIGAMCDDTELIPYVVAEVSKIDARKFKGWMREVLADTAKGDKIKDFVLGKATENMEENEDAVSMKKSGVEKNIISDEYLSGGDIDDMISEMDI